MMNDDYEYDDGIPIPRAKLKGVNEEFIAYPSPSTLSTQVEFKLLFEFKTRNWIRYPDATAEFAGENSREEESSVLVGGGRDSALSFTRLKKALREAIGDRLAEAYGQRALVELVMEHLCKAFLKKITGKQLSGTLRLSVSIGVELTAVRNVEDEYDHPRMVPAAESSMGMLEKCELSCRRWGECCSICLEELELLPALLKMPCEHVFHGECIKEWLLRSHLCPLCRYQMPTEEEE